MNYIIKRGLIESLRNSIDPASTEEQCFLLLGEYLEATEDPNDEEIIYVREFKPVRNSHENPGEFYRITGTGIDPEVISGIVGNAHTHIGEKNFGPSYADVSQFPLDMIGIVIHAPTMNTVIYDATGFLENVK